MVRDEFDEEKYIKNVLDDIEDLNWLGSDILSERIKTSIYRLTELPLSKMGRERLLAQGLGAGWKFRDPDIIKFCIENIPDDIEWSILAYNLACVAATENDKPSLLKYSRKATILDSQKYNAKKFLADQDFDAYTNDPEFLEAIGEITVEEMHERLDQGSLAVNRPLEQILTEMLDGKSKIRNASAMLEKEYAADPDVFLAILSGDDAPCRLMVAAWLAGRDSSPDNIGRAVDEAARLYVRCAKKWDFNKKFKNLNVYADTWGITRFISLVELLGVDLDANKSRDTEDHWTALKNSVALGGGKVPVLYRLYCALCFTLERESSDDTRSDDLHLSFMRCTDVSPSPVKFAGTHKWVGREHRLIQAAGKVVDAMEMDGLSISLGDPTRVRSIEKKAYMKKFDADLVSDIGTAYDTVRELAFMGNSINDGDERFFIAWRLWRNDLGRDLVDTASNAVRMCLMTKFGCDIDEPEKNPEGERAVDWIFGGSEADAKDVLPKEFPDGMYVADEVAYLAEVADFPARFIQLALLASNFTALLYTSYVINSAELNSYLLRTGVNRKTLLKYHLELTGNAAHIFSWSDLAEDTDLVLSVYPELTVNARIHLISRYYEDSNEEKKAPSVGKNYDLMAYSVSEEIEISCLTLILDKIRKIPVSAALVFAVSHERSGMVKERLIELTAHSRPGVSARAAYALKHLYDTVVDDPFLKNASEQGLPVNQELLDLFNDLSSEDPVARGAKALSDKIFKEDPEYFKTLLDHPRPGVRLLVASYLYGHYPDQKYMDPVLRAAAEVYSMMDIGVASMAECRIEGHKPVSGTDIHSEDAAALRRFPEVPGADMLASELERYQPAAVQVYSRSVLHMAVIISEGTVDAVYRLSCLPYAFIRKWGRNRILGMTEAFRVWDGPENDYEIYDIIAEKFPRATAEYDLAASVLDTWEIRSKKISEMVANHPQEALNLVKEYPRWELVPKQALIARHVWDTGAGTEHIDRYVKTTLDLMRESLSVIGQENSDRTMEFIVGKAAVSIDDLVFDNDVKTKLGSFLRLAVPFEGLRDFAARAIRVAIFHDLDTVPLYDAFPESTSNGWKLRYLENNGATPKELLKRKLIDAKDNKEKFALINGNRDLFRQIVGTIWDYDLQHMFISFENAKNPGDLDIFFDEYLARDGSRKYEIDWKDKMEIYLDKMDKKIFRTIFDVYPRKADVIKYAESNSGRNTNAFLTFAGVYVEKIKGE